MRTDKFSDSPESATFETEDEHTAGGLSVCKTDATFSWAADTLYNFHVVENSHELRMFLKTALDILELRAGKDEREKETAGLPSRGASK